MPGYLHVILQVSVSVFLCFSDPRPPALNMPGGLTRNVVSKPPQLEFSEVRT